MAALKFLEDPDSEEAMTNQMWSECVNIELEDLNKMEVDFYRALDWNLFVSLAEFEAFITEALISPLQSHIEIRSPPKGRLQRSVKRKSHALIQSKDRDKELVFSRLPSAKVSEWKNCVNELQHQFIFSHAFIFKNFCGFWVL